MNELIGKLLSGEALDPEIVENLRRADLEEMRALLSRYLPSAHVDAILARVRAAIGEPGDSA